LLQHLKGCLVGDDTEIANAQTLQEQFPELERAFTATLEMLGLMDMLSDKGKTCGMSQAHELFGLQREDVKAALGISIKRDAERLRKLNAEHTLMAVAKTTVGMNQFSRHHKKIKREIRALLAR
jgi:hypothetical protein